MLPNMTCLSIGILLITKINLYRLCHVDHGLFKGVIDYIVSHIVWSPPYATRSGQLAVASHLTRKASTLLMLLCMDRWFVRSSYHDNNHRLKTPFPLYSRSHLLVLSYSPRYNSVHISYTCTGIWLACNFPTTHYESVHRHPGSYRACCCSKLA